MEIVFVGGAFVGGGIMNIMYEVSYRRYSLNCKELFIVSDFEDLAVELNNRNIEPTSVRELNTNVIVSDLVKNTK